MRAHEVKLSTCLTFFLSMVGDISELLRQEKSAESLNFNLSHENHAHMQTKLNRKK